MTHDPDVSLPVFFGVGSQTAEIARVYVDPDPTVWRPRIAELMRQLAEEIENPSVPSENHTATQEDNQ